MPPLKSPRLGRESDSQDIGTFSCEIDSCDIGSYMKVKNITDSAKFRLLTSHFKPVLSFVLLLGANFSINGCINSNLGLYIVK